ncbi:FAD-binding oxidoreductase [Oceanobacillus alkalisoli]|uniref:FAD-binding oxidoreductase n=1 Tax=Oceanobacillus alkalisoli TaxID=2925113 RepID=UPI001EE3C2D6|nr:FAD-linked oxidase C-terminal domain-containing protein [Oceanobacillus alkalisoli]MCG5104680.1 FAD-binding protein [Oceanobacillus alkalisoli]
MEQLLQRLKENLTEDQVTTNKTVRELHGRDETYLAESLPDVVVYPKSTADVVHIIQVAQKFNTPVTPFGVGSSLEGHIIPYKNGITIDFSLMDKILEIKAEDLLVKVQPGVTREQLNKELKKHGLFFTVDPGANATLGGMAATNASGTTSVKYGVMRDQVRDMEVVLADGSIIHTGSLATKSSSGYHLNGLFVGSEGTLGCFTELTLQVYGIPEHTVAARAVFPNLSDAFQAVTSILHAGIPMARVEFVDEASIVQLNKFSDTDYPAVPTLFLEFHGNEEGLKADLDFAKEIMEDHGCQEFISESDTAARNHLWEARHNLAYAFAHDYPGKKMMLTDVAVPISELAGAAIYARKEVDKLGIPGGIAGHVGDGNFHSILMVDLNNEEEIQKAKAFNKNIVLYALERGGTCTGEHGVGVGKKPYQEQEHGASLEVIKQIKKSLDPNNILNPTKIVDID